MTTFLEFLNELKSFYKAPQDERIQNYTYQKNSFTFYTRSAFGLD